MMMGSLSHKDSNHRVSSREHLESEDGELYRLEIRNDVGGPKASQISELRRKAKWHDRPE